MFLELKNTTIGHQTPLIKDVNTTLELGDTCLLVGNNGVGKTTLIKSILNQISALEGELFLGGNNQGWCSARCAGTASAARRPACRRISRPA